jgi:ubiquinone/menaquinone biosynthesis C-methylase UbiE
VSRERAESGSGQVEAPSTTRQPHAVLDLKSRTWKAVKIERLLGLEPGDEPIRLLEVGTGSGGIAQYFATHPSKRYSVDAVDVVDSRMVTDGYRFTLVEGTGLPFADESFDVVLSNHVIEHVGGEREQRRHLAELHRVMCRDGVCYLAVPNRWMLVEPHYRLIFLSWLPRSWRSRYLRMARKGEIYDCEPLRLPDLEEMLEASGFEFRNICVEALRLTFDIERPDGIANALLTFVPDAFIRPFRQVIPTLIYRCRRGDSGPHHPP